MSKKKISVVWSKSAVFDLKSIIEFISKNSPQNARETLALIKKDCLLLGFNPDLGKVPLELKKLQVSTYRELVVAPWRVFYRKEAERIVVLAVIDSRRDIDDALWARMINH